MTTESYTTIILTPSEGGRLTQAGECDIKSRIIASRIAIGPNDSVDNYTEISLEEAEAYETQRAEARASILASKTAKAPEETNQV